MLPLLSIQNLQIAFLQEEKLQPALQDISLEVNRNEMVAIVGESGSGKSITALSILQLLPTPPAEYTNGKIMFSEDGKTAVNLMGLTEKQLQSVRGNKIAMIFQEPMTALNPVFSCGNQVMETMMLHQHITAREAKLRVIELFKKVELPDPTVMFNRFPHEISGGQKQRVMIAMAISCKPALLIADEPTTALDVTVQKNILRLIKELQSELGVGVIFISHDLGLIASLADRVIVMYKGKIVEQGKVENIFTNPQHPYTRALLACRPALHDKGERLPVVNDFMYTDAAGNIIAKVAARDIITTCNTANEYDENNVPLIQAEHLTVSFATGRKSWKKNSYSVKALDDVSVTIYKGETVGLVGESGCGKTTLGRTLLKLINPDSGSVRFNGTDLVDLSATVLRRLRKNFQIIFQDPYSALNPRLSIGKALEEAMIVHGVGGNKAHRRDAVINILEKVHLKADHYNRYPHEFSGGQRQRIGIARALVLNPSFIVCDESVSALDVSVQAQVLNLLNDLKREYQFTLLFISHDLSVVRYISDRILVMYRGKIEESGRAEDIYKSPSSEYTQKLIDAVPHGMPAKK